MRLSSQGIRAMPFRKAHHTAKEENPNPVTSEKGFLPPVSGKERSRVLNDKSVGDKRENPAQVDSRQSRSLITKLKINCTPSEDMRVLAAIQAPRLPVKGVNNEPQYHRK